MEIIFPHISRYHSKNDAKTFLELFNPESEPFESNQDEAETFFIFVMFDSMFCSNLLHGIRACICVSIMLLISYYGFAVTSLLLLRVYISFHLRLET